MLPQVNILNQNTCVLLLQRSLVRLWASYKKLSVNSMEESNTLISIHIYKVFSYIFHIYKYEIIFTTPHTFIQIVPKNS